MLISKCKGPAHGFRRSLAFFSKHRTCNPNMYCNFEMYLQELIKHNEMIHSIRAQIHQSCVKSRQNTKPHHPVLKQLFTRFGFDLPYFPTTNPIPHTHHNIISTIRLSCFPRNYRLLLLSSSPYGRLVEAAASASRRRFLPQRCTHPSFSSPNLALQYPAFIIIIHIKWWGTCHCHPRK